MEKKVKSTKIKAYQWGSHRPLIKTIMEVLTPKHVLEIGLGLFSTPLIYKYNTKLTCIESDYNWISKVLEKLPMKKGFKVIHHNIKLSYKKTYEQVDQKIKDEAVEFYKKFLTPDMDFLFVDHIGALRVDTVMNLYKRFPIIAYHDAEETSDKYYYYHLFKPTEEYTHKINETPTYQTGYAIHKKFEPFMKKFYEELYKNNKLYCSEYGIKFE
jgi:predicted O-methyltransferase YrrM